VRMRVYEARHENAAACVEGWFTRIGGFEFRRRAGRDDPFIAHNDRAIFDDSEGAEAMSALGAALQGEELGGGVDEHVVLVIGSWWSSSPNGF